MSPKTPKPQISGWTVSTREKIWESELDIYKMMLEVVLALLSAVLGLVAFVLYKSIVGPYLQRRHFRQYSNVWVNPSPKLLLHDVAEVRSREQSDPKYTILQYAGDRGLENPDKDFVLVQYGSVSSLQVTSHKALQEVL